MQAISQILPTYLVLPTLDASDHLHECKMQATECIMNLGAHQTCSYRLFCRERYGETFNLELR